MIGINIGVDTCIGTDISMHIGIEIGIDTGMGVFIIISIDIDVGIDADVEESRMLMLSLKLMVILICDTYVDFDISVLILDSYTDIDICIGLDIHIDIVGY